MFKKILVANRGEIAVRVLRACREMGIGSVAVYSDADETALHRLLADESVLLGPAEPAQSYGNIERVVEAAKKSGAEAIHPGYGFLAENADFAAACEDAGLVFIGPPASAIRDLGDKTVAREIMKKAGVPVIPGMTRCSDDPEELARAAREMGFPVLIKAAAGGGGKGMRVVEKEKSLAMACQEAAGEALAAFGNPGIYLEKFLDRPRHVEFQILADTQGNVVHLMERECSIQRRHQKIIEETPSPFLTPGLRKKMGEAAKAAARASGYVNAGTVEFLVDPGGNFYFLEVNTRLQVEHPVTEMVTGIDLVKRQIEIAAGLPLPFSQEDIRPRGHAIECRVYGEDPERDFFPSPGEIRLLREPSGPGVRCDSGVYEGCCVPVEYDPILAKLIVWAEDREGAVDRMTDALSRYAVLGVKTPIAFLRDVLAHPSFRAGETHTNFLAEHFPSWKPSGDPVPAALAFVARELFGTRAAQAQAQTSETPSPWQTLGTWRM